jgi:F-type H+-transporting ATPase subunit gamma
VPCGIGSTTTSGPKGIAFYDTLAQLAYLMVTAQTQIEHPLMDAPKSNVNALIVIGSDRGLCGAYNTMCSA